MTESAVGLVTLVGLVTIALSVYMITYSHQLYDRLRPLLRPFDFGSRREVTDESGAPPVDVIIFGLGRFGSQLMRRLRDAGYDVLGVDLDPVAVRHFAREGYTVRFGDVTEQDFWTELPLRQARWIVLSVPYGAIVLTETDPRSGLVSAIRAHRSTVGSRSRRVATRRCGGSKRAVAPIWCFSHLTTQPLRPQGNSPSWTRRRLRVKNEDARQLSRRIKTDRFGC